MVDVDRKRFCSVYIQRQMWIERAQVVTMADVDTKTFCSAETKLDVLVDKRANVAPQVDVDRKSSSCDNGRCRKKVLLQCRQVRKYMWIERATVATKVDVDRERLL